MQIFIHCFHSSNWSEVTSFYVFSLMIFCYSMFSAVFRVTRIILYDICQKWFVVVRMELPLWNRGKNEENCLISSRYFKCKNHIDENNQQEKPTWDITTNSKVKLLGLMRKYLLSIPQCLRKQVGEECWKAISNQHTASSRWLSRSQSPNSKAIYANVWDCWLL